jgi:methylated-DNA-[protein]-cysteine S-methyltransferase
MKISFADRVHKVVQAIKRGKTMTYGQVAAAAGRPGAARAVGNIMANNKDKSIPCHRVIRADGKLGAYNGLQGASKRELLRREEAI